MTQTIDFSLALINRTGAFAIGSDLVSHLDRPFHRRYWRFFSEQIPNGIGAKVLGRLMLRDVMQRRKVAGTWPRSPGNGDAAVLYLDPLYVLHGDLAVGDAVLCHDIGPISHPEFYDAVTVAAYHRAYAIVARVAPTMLFVSNWTRRQFLRRFPADYRRLVTIPLYVPERLRAVAPERPPGVAGRYVLMVGGLEKRKNYHRALDAFLDVQRGEPELSLVIAGPRGNDTEAVEQRIADCTGISYLGRVSDGELVWLYRNCAAFLQPSLLEGFGMPALEAPLMGALPVLSQDTVFHEVTGDGAVFVDAGDPLAIAAGLRKALAISPAAKRRRLESVHAHAAHFNFQRFITDWRDAFDIWVNDTPDAALPAEHVDAPSLRVATGS